MLYIKKKLFQNVYHIANVKQQVTLCDLIALTKDASNIEGI